jgi:hypothetical protein
MLARSLVQRSYVYPHVRQQCSNLTSVRSFNSRSIGSELLCAAGSGRCGDVAELDANVADKCNRLSTVLALCHLPIIWRGFADSPKILKKRSDSEAAQ